MNSGFMYEGEQKGKVSLFLKQLKLGQRRILFALIGVDVKKEWEEYLSVWFYKRISSMRSTKELMETLEEDLRRGMPMPYGQVSGLCICGNYYISFGKGGVVGAWMYRRFLDYKLKYLHEESEEWQVTSGFLEKGGGILICTKEYLEGVKVEALGKLLLEGRHLSDRQIGKRLGEGKAIERGGAAIFIRL